MLRLAYTTPKRTLLCVLAALAPLAAGAQTPPPSSPALVKTTAPKLFASLPHSKNTLSVSVTAIDGETVHAALADGTALDAAVKRGSVFLVNGRQVAAGAYPVGGQSWLRTRTRASDGAVSVVLLCDAASETALDTYRKQVLSGKVVSADDKTLLVQPDGTGPGGAMVSLHLTAKTVFRQHGAVASAASFPAGSPVSVKTRSLPSGLLMASVVSDNALDLAKAKAVGKTTSLSGSASDVDGNKGQILITPKTKPAQVVAVVPATRITLRKLGAALMDIRPGMHVSARLSAQTDGAGHPVAVSLSASDAPVPMAKRRATTGKKMP